MTITASARRDREADRLVAACTDGRPDPAALAVAAVASRRKGWALYLGDAKARTLNEALGLPGAAGVSTHSLLEYLDSVNAVMTTDQFAEALLRRLDGGLLGEIVREHLIGSGVERVLAEDRAAAAAR